MQLNPPISEPDVPATFLTSQVRIFDTNVTGYPRATRLFGLPLSFKLDSENRGRPSTFLQSCLVKMEKQRILAYDMVDCLIDTALLQSTLGPKARLLALDLQPSWR